jgi:cytochrome c2
MNKREAKMEAYGSCAALIDASSDGELLSVCDGWSEDDIEKFRQACKEVANGLRARYWAMKNQKDRNYYG